VSPNTAAPQPASGPRRCSIAGALEVIGDRWSLLAIRELFYGVHRFNELAANTGAPRDILTARLRKLEDLGVVERREYSSHPPRYEYLLTESGRDLSPVLQSLKRWGDEHVTEGPLPVVFEHDCGHDLVAVMHCQSCRRPVEPGSITVATTAAGPRDGLRRTGV
jgi:DNA-binding HxlR family transcriptional regulator